MLRRHNRDWLPRNVDLQFQQPRVNRREMLLDELGGLMADIQMNIIQAKPLDLMVDRTGHHIAGSKLAALVVPIHEALAAARNAGGKLKEADLPPQRLGNQEILYLQIVEAGRMELVLFHSTEELRVGKEVVGKFKTWG